MAFRVWDAEEKPVQTQSDLNYSERSHNEARPSGGTRTSTPVVQLRWRLSEARHTGTAASTESRRGRGYYERQIDRGAACLVTISQRDMVEKKSRLAWCLLSIREGSKVVQLCGIAG
ncbi:hypothetical protein MAPG_08941 [Magnaporthiopsis poae ATCC 64411]|uniref:Uncharacterized protein n=1 Tax=Magnaporthiopsis poae (strain ATCC 64411 / 73-15) TaxID=644358 RepID=A0A0C4E8M9_MAGP6|nr:hypothetical protein MAPG_08941 [Magnaporthiopsis poae ATCC 64411]